MWGQRRRRLVRFHQADGPTIEGVWVGYDHALAEYRVIGAKLIESEDSTIALEGEQRILRERVYFRQFLGKAA